MRKSEADFSEEDKIKSLLWCDRHCCFCGKACGVNIEIHHIIPKTAKGYLKKELGDIDNAIPLCYNCHAEIGHYNTSHPKGQRFKPEELKIRRNQIYEEHTHHLVPPINYQITQKLYNNIKTNLPDVRFNIMHLGDSNPVRLYFALEEFLGDKRIGLINSTNRIYCGERPIGLNPRGRFFGHFSVDDESIRSHETIEIRVNVKIEDIYGRIHPLYPVGFVYMRDQQDWFYEPSIFLHEGKEEYSLKGWDKPSIFKFIP